MPRKTTLKERMTSAPAVAPDLDLGPVLNADGTPTDQTLAVLADAAPRKPKVDPTVSEAAPFGECRADNCHEPRVSAHNSCCKPHSDAYNAGTFRLSARGYAQVRELVEAGKPVEYGKRDPKASPVKAEARAKAPVHHDAPAPPREPIARVKADAAVATVVQVA